MPKFSQKPDKNFESFWKIFQNFYQNYHKIVNFSLIFLKFMTWEDLVDLASPHEKFLRALITQLLIKNSFRIRITLLCFYHNLCISDYKGTFPMQNVDPFQFLISDYGLHRFRIIGGFTSCFINMPNCVP